MINPMTNAEHATPIATLDPGLRPLRALLAGEVATVPWPVGDSGTELGEDKVGSTLEAFSVGAAVTWMSAVGLARCGVQLESPRKSIREEVALYSNSESSIAGGLVRMYSCNMFVDEPCTVTHWPALVSDKEATWYSENFRYMPVVVKTVELRENV